MTVSLHSIFNRPEPMVVFSACHRDATPISVTFVGRQSFGLPYKVMLKQQPPLIIADVGCLKMWRHPKPPVINNVALVSSFTED